ncbi:MAG: diguanylate cyclase [Gammaproteobacteria bacterium]|nr:diguanylate cyclase [Gammaproteobacteria bacterium]
MSSHTSGKDAQSLCRIGTVQAHGAFLAVDQQGRCLAVSENFGEFIGTPAGDCIGREVVSLAWGRSFARVLERTRHARDGDHLHDEIALGGQVFEVLAHQSDGVNVVEIHAPGVGEAEPPARRTEAVSDRIAFIHDLQAIDDIEVCAERLLHVVAELSGFDRVMLLRFGPDGHAEVIAECLRGEMEGFFGLRFPATDLPASMREEFALNPVHLVPDIRSPAVVIVQATGTAPVDLTYSRLRTPLPAHLDYLGRLKAAASFSLSLVCNGRLWGLIACHHAIPRSMSFEVQCELEEFQSIACMRIGALAERVCLEQHRFVEAAFDDLKHRVSELNERDPCDGVFDMIRDLRSTFEADGCWMKLEGREQTSGKVPRGYAAAALLAWFRTRPDPVCACFDELPMPLRVHDDLRRWASGALYLPLMKDDFVILLRREHVETIRWAGRPPASQCIVGPPCPPRKSFAPWSETVRFRGEPWLPDLQQGARRLQADVNDLLTRAHFAGLAFTDALTGLANRVRLHQFLDESVTRARRTGSTLAVYFLDLDGFKAINDRLGHHAGDELLRIVARRLERLMRAPDLLARLGGDEFIIVQAGLGERSAADAVIRRIHWALGQGISIGDEQLTVGVSVGVALYPSDADSVDGLLRQADAAMYRDKGPLRREA